jgi:hypothetical protein
LQDLSNGFYETKSKVVSSPVSPQKADQSDNVAKEAHAIALLFGKQTIYHHLCCTTLKLKSKNSNLERA